LDGRNDFAPFAPPSGPGLRWSHSQAIFISQPRSPFRFLLKLRVPHYKNSVLMRRVARRFPHRTSSRQTLRRPLCFIFINSCRLQKTSAPPSSGQATARPNKTSRFAIEREQLDVRLHLQDRRCSRLFIRYLEIHARRFSGTLTGATSSRVPAVASSTA
jgi:hypothetical protein